MDTNEVSVHLPFKTIVNCRDLAGITNREGKVIKPSRLLRSASLAHADRHDLDTLANMQIDDIVDLRTEAEKLTSPDKTVVPMKEHHYPVFHEKDLKNAAGSQAAIIYEAADDSRMFMQSVYRQMIVSEDAKKAWKNFFQLLLNAPNGVLWHCTQGKDRTGIAAVLILTALDVDEKTIIEDYMQTNRYMTHKAEVDHMTLKALIPHHERLADQDIETYMFAHEDFYQAAKAAAVDNWGSFEGYLREAIGLSDEDFARLKELYLES